MYNVEGRRYVRSEDACLLLDIYSYGKISLELCQVFRSHCSIKCDRTVQLELYDVASLVLAFICVVSLSNRLNTAAMTITLPSLFISVLRHLFLQFSPTPSLCYAFHGFLLLLQ